MGVIAESVRNKLNFEDIHTYSYCNKTNSIIVSLNVKKNLSEKVKMIEQIQEIQYFALWTYPQQEIADALEDHNYSRHSHYADRLMIIWEREY